jgi:hypothetical protein
LRGRLDVPFQSIKTVLEMSEKLLLQFLFAKRSIQLCDSRPLPSVDCLLYIEGNHVSQSQILNAQASHKIERTVPHLKASMPFVLIPIELSTVRIRRLKESAKEESVDVFTLPASTGRTRISSANLVNHAWIKRFSPAYNVK